MSNFLANGTVLPHGLLGMDSAASISAFNKSYKNTTLRMGIVMTLYPINHKDNASKMFVEYDVLVLEQDGNSGAAPTLYKNCIKSESFGSIADFFETSLRPQKSKKTKINEVNSKGQNGAIVLIQCLDGISEKAKIIGAYPHPDRPTTLIDDGPKLEGEYNGVNIKVESDGSTQLVFNGATDNDGAQLDPSQGPTMVKIDKDGSFEINHKTVTFRLDKAGDVTVTAQGDISLTAQKDVKITSTGNTAVTCVDANLTASGNLTAKCVDATIEAAGNAIVEGKAIKLGKGAAQALVKGDLLKTYIDSLSVATALGPSGPPILPLPPTTLSKKSKVE